MKFCLGTRQPSWLARDLGVPVLVSHRRLAGIPYSYSADTASNVKSIVTSGAGVH